MSNDDKNLESFATEVKLSDDGNCIINFGPQHPAAHGVLRLILEIDDEVVVRADPHIGFLHRGTEKLIETKTYTQSIPYFDRLDYVSPMNQEHTFVLAVEGLLGVEIPERASFIRVIFLELTRILNHSLNITTQALDVGAMTPLLWQFEEREKIMNFYERVSGARIHANYFRVGGVANDVDDELLRDISSFVINYRKSIKQLESLLTNNRIFKQRLVGIGVVSSEDAIANSFSGPMIRGSGIAWDLRKSQPYEIYERLDFSIPIGKDGDCYDRYLVRVAEMYESLNMIEQCISMIKPGKYILDNYKITPPFKGDAKMNMEDMIHHFKFFSDGFNVPAGEIYVATEAPKGEFGVHIVADGSNKPYRCYIRAPGFAHLQATNMMLKGHMFSDTVSIISTQDIVFGEVDR